MRPSHFLVLDPDAVRREDVLQLLRGAGQLPVVAATPAEASQALAVPGLDFVLVALTTPGLDQTQLREALAPAVPAQPEPLEDMERRHIARTLGYTRGNKRRAAHLLGIARSTLLAKVRKYGLDSVGDGGE
ncbi:MAG TPA: helix-turn-helix domain-containing protein [Gemmatimonadales bacterium]|nr:helix-turn-helix domain-containing protein [Gemmatimonadales bacterium]